VPLEERSRLRVSLRADNTHWERAVSAVHSRCPPDRIGISRVGLLRRDANRLLVDELEAHDGSPVLDIKSG
jgi:tRNA (Thr-GGU) A37 N-methylase